MLMEFDKFCGVGKSVGLINELLQGHLYYKN